MWKILYYNIIMWSLTSATSSLSQRMGGVGLVRVLRAGGRPTVSSSTVFTRLSRLPTLLTRGSPVSSHLCTHGSITSVLDPNPPDPHFFGPPGSGSGSTSQWTSTYIHHLSGLDWLVHRYQVLPSLQCTGIFCHWRLPKLIIQQKIMGPQIFVI